MMLFKKIQAFVCFILFTLFVHAQNSELTQTIAEAERYAYSRLIDSQYWEGYFYSDTSFTSHYLILHDYLRFSQHPNIEKMLRYLLHQQNPDGSWSLYNNGPGDLGLSSLNYLALSLHYDQQNTLCNELDQSLLAAKDFILSNGGLNNSNSITKIFYALYGIFPWENHVDFPLIFFSKNQLVQNQLPLNMQDLNWLRTAVSAYAILKDMKPNKALHANQKQWLDQIALPNTMYKKLNHGIKVLDNKLNDPVLKKAFNLDLKWNKETYHKYITQHLLHSIEPDGSVALATPVAILTALALHTLNSNAHSETIKHIHHALLEKQFIFHSPYSGAFQQFSRSGVWDTAFFIKALDKNQSRLENVLSWLISKTITSNKDNIMGTAWAFEPFNTNNPDNDTSSVVLSALIKYKNSHPGINALIPKATQYLLSMQNDDGGWSAFDKNLNTSILSQHAFADTVFLTDASTPDITCHVLETLGQLGYTYKHREIGRALAFLWQSRVEVTGEDGKLYPVWKGAWGLNYLYATASCLLAFESIQFPHDDAQVYWAQDFILSKQNGDGGWGETPLSDYNSNFAAVGNSRPTSTAYALLALLALNPNKQHLNQIEKGVQWLLEHFSNGTWPEHMFVPNATNFSKLNYSHYEFYPHYFPLMALKKFIE